MKDIDIVEWEICKSNNKIMQINNFKKFDVSWEVIIDLINDALSKESDVNANINDGYSKPKYVKKNAVSSILGTIGYVQFSSEISVIPKEINSYIEIIDKILNYKLKRNFVQIFCNMLSMEYQSEIHSDPWDGVVFQLKGTTTWDTFNEDKTDIIDSIVLEEGGLLLVPKGAIHRVTSNSSRATLNFGLGE